MTKTTTSIAAIGLTAIAAPVAAQSFYLGGAISQGYFQATGTGNTAKANIQSYDVFGGARFDLNTNMYWGVEVQGTLGRNYPISEPYLSSTNMIYQGELHLGYNLGRARVYGFVGVGGSSFASPTGITSASVITTGGVGTEIAISKRAAIRLEAELSRLSINDACCGLYNPVTQADVSAGVVFSF